MNCDFRRRNRFQICSAVAICQEVETLVGRAEQTMADPLRFVVSSGHDDVQVFKESLVLWHALDLRPGEPGEEQGAESGFATYQL